MKIRPIDDKNSRFDLVELKDDNRIHGMKAHRLTPHCKIHGAMNKVSLFKNGGGFWRCLQSIAVPDCRAGCIEYEDS